ncbi:MAG: undecaprenyl-phosphate glucose phosphotransferase [Bacteroidales bacterium]
MERKYGLSFLYGYIVTFVDVIILNTVFVALYLYFFDYLSEEAHSESRLVILCYNFAILVQFHTLCKFHNKRSIDWIESVRKMFISTSLLFVIFIALLTFTKVDGYSRLVLIYFFISFLSARAVWWLSGRALLKLYREKGYNYRNTVILGGGKNGQDLLEVLQKDRSLGCKCLGFFDDNDTLIDDESFLGRLDEFENYINQHRVDVIFCALPHTIADRIMPMMRLADRHTARFYIIPNSYVYLKRKVYLDQIDSIPYLSMRNEPLEYRLNQILKRTFDILFSLLFLVTLFPIIYIVVAIAIKSSSPGPIFFKQTRTGLNGADFTCYKFRTMHVNSQADTQQAEKNDPRKTRLGNFLRKSSIDELPQFINVLLGDMSVVGPRPHMLRHTEEYSAIIDRYMVRHLIKPGITGWAQVNGFRGETKTLKQMESRIKRDVWYLENWSFLLDVRIILLTILNAIRGEENAY